MDDKFQITESEIKIHIDLIILWMIKYGGIEKSEAYERFINANLHLTGSGKYNKMFFHEEPYYWAMTLLLGFDNNKWYQDSNLWPPPEEYRTLEEKYYNGEIAV